MLDSNLKELLKKEPNNEKYQIIKEIIKEEDWYKKVAPETVLNILDDLGIDKIYYLEMISK